MLKIQVRDVINDCNKFFKELQLYLWYSPSKNDRVQNSLNKIAIENHKTGYKYFA